MSNPEDREKRSRRVHDVETHIERRRKLIKAKSVYFDGHVTDKQPHRLYKCSGMNCGNSHCVMCGNPRKFFKQKTIQERSFDQLPAALFEFGEDLEDEISKL